jgi:TolB-like protein
VTSFAESLKNGTWTRSPEQVKRPSPAPVAVSAGAPAAIVDSAPAAGPVTRSSLPQGSLSGARKRRRRSTALAFVLGGLLVIAIGLTTWYAKVDDETIAALSLIRTRPPAKLEPRQIIVAPFENKTGDASLDPVGDLIAEWLSRELGEADFIVVDARTARIANRVVQGTPRALRPEEKVAIGEESGSRYAIVGTFYPGGRDSIQANVNVVDVGTRQTLRTLGPFRGSAQPTEEFLVRMLEPTVAYLRAEVDTSAGGRTTRFSSPTTTAVQQRVNQAWENFFQNPSDTTSVFAELDAAAKLDSTYPMPPLMKAYMLDVKSRWASVNQLVERAKPLSSRMSRLERTALELFEADLRGDAINRVSIARRLQAMSPGSTEMPLLRVVSALYIGNVTEALAALKDVDPTRGMNVKAPTYFEWGATTYHHSGDASLEERAVAELQKRFRDKPAATFALARLHAADNDSELDDILRRGVPTAVDRDARADSIDFRLFAARELRSHGYPAPAKKIFDETAARFWGENSNPPTSIDDRRRRARAVYETGDDNQARTLFQAILASDSTDLEAMGRIGAASVRLRDSATAQAMDDMLRSVRTPYLMGGPLRWRAAIASAQGRSAEAVSLLDMAIRQGYRLLDNPMNLTVHLDRDFAGIEKTAAYKAMIRSLTDASAATTPK